MAGIDGRTLRVVWTIFLFGLFLLTVYAIRDTLILVAVAIFFAYMLSPLVDLVCRFMPKRRVIALAIVYVLLVGLIVTLGITIGSKIADQASSLAGQLPKLLQDGQVQKLPLPGWLEPLRTRIMIAAQAEAADLQNSIVPFLQHSGAKILSGLGSVLLVILIPVVSFFLLKDAKHISAALTGWLEEIGHPAVVENIVSDIDTLLSKYIRALVILACASFATWALFLTVTGAPYQLLLAGIAGTLEFIPVIGPVVSLIIVLLVCGISGYTTGLLWILIFWGLNRMFQDYVLSPYLMSAGVEIHPLLVLLGVLAGGHIGGVPGAFFSVPVIAILRVVFIRLYEAQKRSKFQPRQVQAL
jgi:predicted PurR-regulated permease PerM